MTGDEKDPTKKLEAESEADEGTSEADRSTVAPPFDPIAFAREVLSIPPSGRPPGMPSLNPPAGVPSGKVTPKGFLAPPRPPMPTFTDETELEDARRRSLGSVPPREGAVTGPPPSTGEAAMAALSLVEARLPSPAPTKPGGVDEDWSELDRAWSDEPFDTDKGNEGPPTRKAPEAEVVAASTPAKTSEREPEPFTRKSMSSGSGAAVAAPRAAEPATAPPAAPAERGQPSGKPGDLEPAHAPSGPPPTDPSEMRDRFSLGDYTGALAIAEALIEKDPDDAEAKECAENCRATLQQMYTARIGPLDRVPVVMVPREQLRWLSIDHRSGFVLSHIDGVSSLEMILDVSGMAMLDALRILCELSQQRIISFR